MNLIIMGNSRSGKTMLARKICSSIAGFSIISMDHLVMTFKKVFPDLQIDYYGKEETVFTKFIEQYLDNVSYKSWDINFIFEGARLPYTVIERLKQNPQNKIIFLGKPNIKPKDFFDEIRKYEKGLVTGGWTKSLDDNKLLSWCTDWIKKAQKQQEYCKQNDIMFFDTSFNQMDVLDNIVNEFKKKNEN